jgi:hypothetical protein
MLAIWSAGSIIFVDNGLTDNSRTIADARDLAHRGLLRLLVVTWNIAGGDWVGDEAETLMAASQLGRLGAHRAAAQYAPNMD